MKFVCLLFSVFTVAVTFGQRTDTFAVKRTITAGSNKFFLDTFVQRTYLSEKTETANRIVYRTGIKITGPNSLILFKATQSILDSTGIKEDKNASIGEYTKVLCTQNSDSIFFILNQRLSSRRNPGTMLEITKTYSGTKVAGAIWMEISTTSASLEVIPKLENERFVLFKEELKVTRRKRQ